MSRLESSANVSGGATRGSSVDIRFILTSGSNPSRFATLPPGGRLPNPLRVSHRLEKLKREIERLAGSIIRQEVVDHGLNAAMTAWHLTDWTWREIQGSTLVLRALTARGRIPIRELKQFQGFVKRDCAELAYCEGIAVFTKNFAFSKLPVFSTEVTERFKISPVPISKDGATLHQFSPTGESITYTAQAAELWISDGRSLTPAAEILENAYQWWRKFIDEMSIS